MVLRTEDNKPAVTIKARTGISKTRKFTSIPNIGGVNKITGPNNSLQNLVKGVAERLFFVKDSEGGFRRPPEANGQAFRTRMAKFAEELAKRTASTTPYTYEQFAEKYEGRKRTIYRKAAASLRHTRLNREDANVKTFVKWEKTNVTLKPNFVPRIIQPRSPRYNVSLGRYLSKEEKNVMKRIDEVFGHPTIMSGRNSAQQAEAFARAWKAFDRPVAIGLDASRFDQHVGQVALKWEHSIWLQSYIGKDKQELTKLLRRQLVNRGKGYTAEGKISYQINGGRMSGDMNTSAGNKLIMCGLVYSYMYARRITHYRLLNNGDDCVIIINQSDLNKFTMGLERWFTTMGFTMKVEQPVYRLEEIEFCQTHPVFDGSEWRMVRTYPLALDKDSTCFITARTMGNAKKWMRAVGTAGMSLAGGIPVAQEHYQAYLRETIGSKLSDLDPWSGLYALSRDMHHQYTEVTPIARASFYAAFGVTPDCQIAIETELQAWRLADHKQKNKLPDGPKLPGNRLLLSNCACPLLGAKHRISVTMREVEAA